MQPRPLGKTGLSVTPIGFGAFKIGRNQKVKYPTGYDLPDDRETERLLRDVLDAGINHVDTAPAYGLSEDRIGRFLGHRHREFVLSTKVGEDFDDGRSTYDFSTAAVRNSVLRSLKRLRRDVLDLVFVHSDGNDLQVLRETDVVGTLLTLKTRGLIRAVGFSGKTLQGTREALAWADAVMIEFHSDDRTLQPVIAEAARRNVGIVVKKPLAAGHLDPAESLRFVLGTEGVTNAVVGSLNTDHLRANVDTARALSAECGVRSAE